MRRIFWILALTSVGWAQTLSLNEIMSRVAANQAKSVEARKEFVYRQEVLVEMHQPNGKSTCEQRQEFAIAPTPDGIERKLVSPQPKEGEQQRCTVDLTGSSGQHLSTGFGSDGNSSFHASLATTKDGMPLGMFPLTPADQPLYQYKLARTEIHNGHKVYRVKFQPNKKKDADGHPGFFKGEALIDAEEFQPVEVNADMSMGIPLAVKVLLGTNVRGVGFNVNYQRLADGVWFPGGFKCKFSVRALFFFRQDVSLNLANSDFRRTDVMSTVTYTGK
jgi:hypothetical protein